MTRAPLPVVHAPRREPWRSVRNALALAMLSLKLVARDRRAFVFSMIFPLGFLFVFGLLAGSDARYMVMHIVPMLVSLSIVTGSFFGQGMSVVVQRERGMLRRYRLTPLGAGGMLGGTLLAGLAMVAFNVALQLFLLRVVFHARLDFPVLPFIVIALVGAASMACLGLIIAAVTSTMQEAQIVFQITFMGSLFLSGLTVPLEEYPVWVQKMAVFLPPTHLMKTLQHALTGRASLREDALPLFALALMAVAAFTIAARLFRWERDDPLPRRAKWSALLALTPVLLFGLWQNAHTRPPHPQPPPPPPPRAR